MTGLSDDLQQIDDKRKTAVIDAELARLNVDIAALQETRLAENGSLRESQYTFFWKGKDKEDRREHGVGFAVRTSLLPTVTPPTGGNERLLCLRLNYTNGPVNLISVYAPTLSSSPEIKDCFYSELDGLISQIPQTEDVYLLGDFNARVGAEHDVWPACIGHHGVGKINENGQRLLELCCARNLCVTNTYFPNKEKHRVSWMHPRSHRWHQLDLVLTKRKCLQTVHNTRSYHSADCDTDHSLVVSKVVLQGRKIFHHARPRGLPRISTARATDPACTSRFMSLVGDLQPAEDGVSADSRWRQLSTAIHRSAITAYGRKERRNVDWYEANLQLMEPLTQSKREALIRWKEDPTQQNLLSLRACRAKCQEVARKCANSYWLQLCSSIERASLTGNVRAMYEGIKQATGPTIKKTAPLKSKSGTTITDPQKQMERWVEHYLELYSTENTVSEEAINSIPTLSVLKELDTEPTLAELEKAIDALACGKAPGNDAIPPEVIKQGKPALLPHLHELLSLCWKEGSVPQDMRDAKIVTLFKNKGDRSVCDNYRGISLLSIVGKIFARVVLSRLQVIADRVYPETQCGFRAGRSTIDMVFSVRQLQEKCREQNQPLYLAFVDLTKAFDLVSRSGLFKLLERIGCPPKLLSIIKSFHDNMRSTVSFDGNTSEPFPILSGVKQGCVLAPTLFGIFFSLLLSYAFRSSDDGVYIHTRHDGKLFNLARLRAKTKTIRVLLRELLFADDAALASHSEQGLQRLLDCFSSACHEFSLTISIKKTVVMVQNAPCPPVITVNGSSLAVVDRFTYLGSTVTHNLSLDIEINIRIGRAASVMSKLKLRVWENKNLSIQTKLRVYEACVLGTLLYGSETWTTYAVQEAKLNAFHMRCLRRILGITWMDRVTNSEVLRRARSRTMYAILSERRLRWLGHVHRMDQDRIPKDLLYGQLECGTRKKGRPHLRYKDVCKRDLRAAHIDSESWESIAPNRTLWKSTVKTGVKRADEDRDRLRKEKREKQKSKSTQHTSTFICKSCSRDCHSRIGLYSHQRTCSRRRVPSSAQTAEGR